MREHRDRHQQKLDRNQHYEELEESRLSDKLKERFRLKPYALQSQSSRSVADYMAKKYDIKRELEK